MARPKTGETGEEAVEAPPAQGVRAAYQDDIRGICCSQAIDSCEPLALPPEPPPPAAASRLPARSPAVAFSRTSRCPRFLTPHETCTWLWRSRRRATCAGEAWVPCGGAGTRKDRPAAPPCMSSTSKPPCLCSLSMCARVPLPPDELYALLIDPSECLRVFKTLKVGCFCSAAAAAAGPAAAVASRRRPRRRPALHAQSATRASAWPCAGLPAASSIYAPRLLHLPTGHQLATRRLPPARSE